MSTDRPSASPASAAPQDQVVWLIERIQAMQINGKATYWSGDEELPPGGETTDPWDACWFPRKQDAARVAVGRFGKNLARSGWQIVEHVFSAPPPPLPASARTVTRYEVGMFVNGDPNDLRILPSPEGRLCLYAEVARLLMALAEAEALITTLRAEVRRQLEARFAAETLLAEQKTSNNVWRNSGNPIQR
jgi:hypothetical protein